MAAQIGKIGCAMNTFFGKKTSGFTIIELMIVLIIVALLVALAYPSYIDYVRKSKRGEAQQLLLNWAINQEIYRSNNPTYADGDALTEPCNGVADCDYDFGVTDITGATYTLTATARAGNDQVNDKAKDGVTVCTLTLNQNGVKEPAVCWD